MVQFIHSMKKILLSLFICFQINAYSQCLTDHIQKQAELQYPSILSEKLNFYNNIQQFSNLSRATKYIIPVVFHVIHTNGPENISQAQIENQIKILNEDFSLTNSNKSAIRAPFVNIASDCQIEFRLAKIDPQGNCTNGINRIFNSGHLDARDEVKSIPNARWPNTKYLNIWVVSSIKENGSTGGTTLGYAYLPSSIGAVGSGQDGIVMRSDWLGVIGTGTVSGAGRTLTHEVGHYLGLLHTFQDGCDATNDYCGDTPPVASTFTNAGCPGTGNSCSNDNPNLIDQWENYMDYSSGACQSMFSANQKTIMHNALTTYSFRKNMVSSVNLIATGVTDVGNAPKAFFNSSARTVCVGELVSFYDNSCAGIVNSRSWQFPGSNTTSTNKDTPRIVYNTPGKYKVTLMATNNAGSNTLAVDNYIEVLPNVSPNKPTIQQGFENANWNVSNGWTVLDQLTTKLTVTSSVAFSGSKCLYAPISSAITDGQKFQLVVPSVDLRNLKTTGKLSMMLAYTRQNSASQERLRVYMSKGCSNTNWVLILNRSASQISYSTSAFTTTFQPVDKTQWKMISVSLSPYENDSNINFMIEIESGSGNAVYIDDINISQFNTDINLLEKSINLNVFPNPTSQNLTIQYQNLVGETEIWLENIEGKKIDVISENNTQTGDIAINWSSNNFIPIGVYILKIKANEQVISKKIIFAN